jgi:hypothetical protein
LAFALSKNIRTGKAKLELFKHGQNTFKEKEKKAE